MTKPQDKIVGIGLAAVDFLGVVDRLPANSMALMGTLTIQGGGNVATALVTLAQLGRKVAFVGKISDDMFGDHIRSELEQAGVDLSGLVIDPGKVSPFTFVAVEAASGQRALYHTPGNCAPLSPKELDLSILDEASALLVDGHQVQAQIAAAERANEIHLPVYLDASGLSEGMGELLSLADVLLATERFAAEIAPMGELEDSLSELGRMGPDTVVITLGREGSVGMSGDEIVRVDAYPVDVVDTTGAGDVYRGAFVHAHLAGWSLERCMRFASAAASLTCRELGGRAGIPTQADIDAALSKERDSSGS